MGAPSIRVFCGWVGNHNSPANHTQRLPEGGKENSPGRKPWEKAPPHAVAPKGRLDTLHHTC